MFLPIISSIYLDAQKNRLTETVLLSTHNIRNMFWLRNKKNIFLLRTLNLSPDLACMIMCMYGS